LSRYLLDLNVLLAVVWQDHEFHDLSRQWFQETGKHDFATNAFTQAGFVRLSTNPRYVKRPVDAQEAIEALGAFTKEPGHAFWPLDIGLQQATAPFIRNVFGTKQITDAYLLGQAIWNDGILVTLDRAFSQMAGKQYAKHIQVLANASPTPSRSR
jgi:toxin-antitoxin system PIN domain toxin